MRIRLAEQTDAAGIASVHVRVWQTANRGIISDTYLQELSVTDRKTGWIKRLDDKSIITLLAEENGKTVGFIAGGKSRDTDDPPSTAEIYSIYIDDTYSRSGIGSALVEQIVERMRRSGFKVVILWVLSANASARVFYEKLKMQSDVGKVRQIVIGGQAHTEVRYRLSIAKE